jgi:hypothetical protein
MNGISSCGSHSFPLRALFILLIALPFAPGAFAAEDPVDRWATAAGGRDKIAGVRAVYREATVQVAGLEGSIKAWHTAEGKYRKEERVASFSSVETFDGANGTVQKGAAPAQRMAGPEIRRATSTAYANWNSVFFAFFPQRRHGSLAVEDDGTIVLRPDGGIDWRVTLDPQTSLPKVMEHREGDRTVSVTFVAYETIEGIRFEKEIHRTNGDPHFDSVIRFTKTVINPPVDAALFSADPEKAPPAR